MKRYLGSILVLAACAIIAAGCGTKPQPVKPDKPDTPSTPVTPTTEYVAKAEMPILAWYSIPAEYATLERYKELKNCGFTINFSHIYSLEAAKQSLDLAQQAGVKVMFMCGDVFQTQTERIVNEVKDHPALYGYFLRDEPFNADLPALGEWAERVRAADPNHPVYLNLNPIYVSEEALGSSYQEHVKLFIETVHPTLLSFDNYPVLENGNVRDAWWQNLEIISQAAKDAGIPFWAFTLSTAHHPYPVATMASMRLQLYTNLAYGAQCLQYFTYWCPVPGTWDFHDAPISVNGERTAVYDLVKAMNEEIQARAGVFVGCTMKKVYHFGGDLPVGVMPLPAELPEPLKKLDTGGKGVIVSLLENGDYQYVMLVNRSHLEGFDYNIGFTKDVGQVYPDGSIVNIPGRTAKRTLDKGDCAIFRLKK